MPLRSLVSRIASSHFIATLALALVTYSPAPLLAETLDLTTLDGTNGFAMHGSAQWEFTGSSMSAAGDVNGDGYDDLVVGAWDAPAGTGHGKCYVLFGRPAGTPPVLDPATLNGTNGYVINGLAPDSHAGWTVTGVGDMNGDQLSDILVSEFGVPGPFTGAEYVIFGKQGPYTATFDLSTLNGQNGFKIEPSVTGEQSGRASASAGDVNGDGLSDLILGDSYAIVGGTEEEPIPAGSAFVLFGKQDWSTSASINLNDLQGENGVRMNGSFNWEGCGASVAGAGDVNGDGIDDVLIGCPSAGAAFVVFGRLDWTSTPLVDLWSVDGSSGFWIDSPAEYDYLGQAMAGPGDVNGDGFHDLLVGAPGAYQCYLVLGKEDWSSSPSISIDSLDGTNGATLDGSSFEPYPGYGVGRAVAGPGDFNGDGYADMAIGHSYADACHIVWGRKNWSANPQIALGDESAGCVTMKGAWESYTGDNVSAASDFNADGFLDLLVAAWEADTYRGTVYLVYGSGIANGHGSYKSRSRAGDSPRAPVGGWGPGHGRGTPPSRAWLDFDGGLTSSTEITTVTRSKQSIPSLTPVDQVGDVVWQIETDRTGWTNAEVTLKYTDEEIAAIAGASEANLTIYKAPAPEGPWTRLPTTRDTNRNLLTATIQSFSYFAIGSLTAVPVQVSKFTAE